MAMSEKFTRYNALTLSQHLGLAASDDTNVPSFL